MKKLLLICLIISTRASFAQINVQWESRYTGAGSNIDQASDMEIDNLGNVYVTGSSYNGAGVGFDLVTIKYDNAGTQLWVSTLNGSYNGYDVAHAITIDASGNVYVTGFVQIGATNYSYVTVKYNSLGMQQWVAYYDASGRFDESKDIAVDASGNVYVTGSFVASSTNTNYGTIKYDASGAQLWVRSYSSSGSYLDAALKIALDTITGDVVVTGNSTNGGNLDYTTVKYNAAGTQQWAVSYDQNSGFDTPTDIVIDGSSNIYITGFSYYNALQDANYATIKYNSSGTQQWAQVYNGVGSDYDKANALVVDALGNVIVTGRSVSGLYSEDMVTILYNSSGTQQWINTYTSPGTNFDEATDIVLDTSGDIYITGFSYLTSSNNDYLTIKYDVSGNQIWITRFDGPASNSDQAMAMAVDPTGNIYITGNSKGSGTNSDYSTIKYCQLLTDGGADVAMCVGDTVTLTATGGNTFIWSPTTDLSNPTSSTTKAYPSTTTIYVVSSTNTNGCLDIDSVTVTINPLPGPVITPSGPTIFCMGDSVTLNSDVSTGYSWNTSPSDTLQSVTVFTSGNYAVTVIDSMGCSNSTNIVVTAHNLPSISAGLDDSICPGDSTQLTASDGSSYVWINTTTLSDTISATPWATPVDTTTYTVVGTDLYGCVNSDSVTIIVFPPAVTPTISTVGFVLVSSNASTYQWYFNGVPIIGATSQTYDAELSGNGDYTVYITNGNGCGALSSITSITTIDISQINYAKNILVYPNPNNGSFSLEIPTAFATDIAINMYSSTGVLVYSHSFSVGNNNNPVVSVNVAPGIYLLELQTVNGNDFRRLVIE